MDIVFNTVVSSLTALNTLKRRLKKWALAPETRPGLCLRPQLRLRSPRFPL